MIMRFFQVACRQEIVLSSVRVTAVVGILLNLINQWDAVAAMDPALIHWPRMLLTFCVPYLVSTYASVVTVLRSGS
jgi:hypothetical protein